MEAFSLDCERVFLTFLSVSEIISAIIFIYQRFLEYIYRNSKYINDSTRNIDLPTKPANNNSIKKLSPVDHLLKDSFFLFILFIFRGSS
ncbi:hypothetical protein COM04_28695 [Bacillus wiedmannii]|nr:hypothetical protein CON92_21175 [Bacillus wiedmannii]PEG08185.1 hypothetical protein CON96_20325 [Bacillus wiedmannii]PEI66999.1 hypothetical protein CN905_28625 [Bacillus wiedmannii]PEJ43024.1 hypothetical protein CN676_28485 [Bacillus wiedmannii]PEL38261.1 hypothetical protein CN607_26165 [Bacillus wiedmannii]